MSHELILGGQVVDQRDYMKKEATAASVDAETTLLTVDFRYFKQATILLYNGGGASITYYIYGVIYTNGIARSTTLKGATALAGATLASPETLTDAYEEIKITIKSTVGGVPSDSVSVAVILKR